MSTLFLDPGSTKIEIEQSINNNTRFVLITDHYPCKMGSSPGAENWIHNIMKQFPDCLFINAVYRQEPFDNEIWFPFHFFRTVMDTYEWNADFDVQRHKTCNAIGGQSRISRTLLSFWLAKNYPMENLIYNFTQNESLLPIQKIIEISPYHKKSHLHPRKFLVDNFKQSFEDSTNREVAIKHLLPNIISKSYIALSAEATGVELGAKICGYTHHLMLGGNIVLPIGNFMVHSLLENLGFDTFPDLLNFNSLMTEDRYQMSIGVLEDNKKVLCDHELVQDYYHSNTSRLEHNRQLILDFQHFTDYFKPKLKVIKDALGLVDPNHAKFFKDFRDVGQALTWIKNFSQ